MKINIVTVSSGWILQKIAERIQHNNKTEHEFVLSNNPRNDVDANFYVDIQNCFKRKSETIDIGMFTHADQNNIKTVNNITFELDYIVHMCQKYYDKFLEKYPKEKMSVIHPVEILPQFKLKKPLLGIVQRGGFVGKGENFMASLDNEILKNFRFLFVGVGWDYVVEKYKDRGFEVEYQTDESYETYVDVYNKIDYLVIPSIWEGGPMSVIEALATGVPIISSNVGFVPDYGVEYMFEPNDVHEFYMILGRIYYAMLERRNKVTENYSDYCEQLIKIIEEIK